MRRKQTVLRCPARLGRCCWCLQRLLSRKQEVLERLARAYASMRQRTWGCCIEPQSICSALACAWLEWAWLRRR